MFPQQMLEGMAMSRDQNVLHQVASLENRRRDHPVFVVLLYLIQTGWWADSTVRLWRDNRIRPLEARQAQGISSYCALELGSPVGQHPFNIGTLLDSSTSAPRDLGHFRLGDGDHLLSPQAAWALAGRPSGRLHQGPTTSASD